MKNKFLTILFLCFFLISGCASAQEAGPLAQVAEQAEQALPEDFQKKAETQVYTVSFINEAGNELTYHICQTVYTDPQEDTISAVNTDAIRAVFDCSTAQLQKELQIENHPAAIYQLDEITYLCCTSSPQTSIVLEYPTGLIPEEDGIKIIQSVYQPRS